MDANDMNGDGRGDGSETADAMRSRIVALIHNDEFRKARAELRASNALTREEKKTFMSELNASLLAEKRVEWTSHGIKRSFRFWSKRKKVKYLKFANQLVEELRTLTDEVCLGFGSVLSIVRQGDLIPHDDDLDIILVLPGSTSLTSSLSQVQEFLLKQDYSVKGRHISHRKVKRKGIYKVDVFVGVREDEKLSIFPSKRRLIQYSDVFPTTTTNMFGCECRIPGRPLDYLSSVYGKDWRVPKPGWHHSWDKGEYADLL